MNSPLLSSAALLIFAPALGIAAVDHGKLSVSQLIDSLQDIDSQTVGIHATAWVSGFLPDSTPRAFGGGVIGSANPKEFGQMRELVRRGVASLPDLLRHIDDSRPTKLSVGADVFPIGWAFHSDEYDPRRREKPKEPKTVVVDGRTLVFSAGELRVGDSISLPYVVTVGDVCFALVGQITNRNLVPLRYQPSGGFIVNSPAHDSALAERVRRDWVGITANELMESLIRDAMDLPIADAGLVRLRLFYPDEYQKQKLGPLRQKIEEFESKRTKG